LPGRSPNLKKRLDDPVFKDQVTIVYKNELGKQQLYQELLTSMLSDQWDWIRDREHVRVIDENNCIESLRMAEQANLLAKNSTY